MDGYLLWSIIGGIGTIILVLLSYMGFFSYKLFDSAMCRKVACTAEETEEILLAFSIVYMCEK